MLGSILRRVAGSRPCELNRVRSFAQNARRPGVGQLVPSGLTTSRRTSLVSRAARPASGQSPSTPPHAGAIDGWKLLVAGEAPDDRAADGEGSNRFDGAALEVGRRNNSRIETRVDHSGLLLWPPRDFEVEQDRGSQCSATSTQNWRATPAPQPPHRHRTERQHHDENRSQNPLRTR